MDNLPNELLLYIFDHLNIDDLNICEQVSKRFKHLTEVHEIDDAIVNDKKEDYGHWWFNSKNEPLNYKNSITLNTLLVNRSKYRLEQTLKRLHIHYTPKHRFNFNCLNSFSRLYHLDVESNSYDSVYCFQSIRLDNLIILKLHYLEDRCKETRLYLKTPRLLFLRCSNLKMIKIAEPLSIVHLETTTNDEQLDQFQNLLTLKIDYCSKFDVDVLGCFFYIEELHLNSVESIYNGEFQSKQLNTAVDYLMKRRIFSNELEFKIYFEGVQLIDRQLKLIHTSKSRLHFLLRNWDNLSDDLFFVVELNYTELLKYTFVPALMCHRIPVDLHHKLYNIQEIQIKHDINNLCHFIEFLNQIKNLRSLLIENTNLPQEFYRDYLPTLDQLESLTIEFDDSNLSIDFDFISTIKRLTSFETNLQSKHFYDLAIKSFEQLSGLALFKFRKGDNFVEISRQNETDKYKLKMCDSHRERQQGQTIYKRKCITKKELITYVNELRLLDMISSMKIAFK